MYESSINNEIVDLPILPKRLVRDIIAIAIINFVVFFMSSIYPFLVIGLLMLYTLFFFQIIHSFLNKGKRKWSIKKYKIIFYTSELFSIAPLVLLILYVFFDLLNWCV